MKTTVKLIILMFVALVALTACEPGSEIHRDHDLKAYQPLNLTLTLDAELGTSSSKPDIAARLFDKYNLDNTYPIDIIQKPDQPNQFNLNANNLGAGQYRLIIEVPYERNVLGLSLGRTQKIIRYDFQIHDSLPYSCFNFNNQEQALKGWESPGVYLEDKEQAYRKAPCPGLFFINQDWPSDLKQSTSGGSIFIPVSKECFPTSSNQQSKPSHWRFSLLSPDLTTNTDWQNITAMNFRIASSTIPIKIIPEVHFSYYGKKSSTNKLKSPKSIYDISNQGWTVIQYPINIPSEATINRLEFHVYGIPEQTVGESVKSIFFDGVCPVQKKSKPVTQ